MPVTIAIRLASNRLFCGEEILASLDVVNSEKAVVSVPDATYLKNLTPVYHLTGPDYPGGVFFNLAGIVNGVSAIDRSVPIAVPLQVDEDSTKTMQFSLSNRMPVHTPGPYTIEAWVMCGGNLLQSEPFRFDLIEPTELATSFARVEGVTVHEEVWSSGLLRSYFGGALVRRTYYRPEDGSTMVPGPTRRFAAAGPQCSAPVSSFVRQGISDRQWVAYFEGLNVFAHSLDLETPLKLQRPGPIHAIVPSPIALATGALEVFVLERDNVLTLIRFYPPQEPELPVPDAVVDADIVEGEDEEEDDDPVFIIPPPEVVFSRRLSGAPNGLTVRPDAVPGRYRLLYSVASERGVVVRHLVFGGPGDPVAEGTAFLPGVDVIPGAIPSFRVERNGMSRVSLLFTKKDSANPGAPTFSLYLADLHFDASGVICIAPGTKMERISQLESEPDFAALDLFEKEARSRLDWAVRLGNGRVVRSNGDDSHYLRPLVPIQMLSTEYVTLLATQGPSGSPEVELY